TPGHEAFTAMRARGAQVTDVAVLVVAADDGVMPQTVEAISHAKAAQVPMVVAINKIDKDGANPDRVKQGFSEQGLVPEEWGGQTVMVPVSAKQKKGIPELLEMILLVADLQDLKANPAKLAAGTIIDAHLEKGRGPVATVLVQSGTLRVGDNLVVGHIFGKVRALIDDLGRKMKEAGPATPAVVTGLPDVPTAGDILLAAVSNALVIAFNVKADALAQKAAEREKVDIRSYDVVYNVTNDIERAIQGLYEPTFVQVWEGRADVLTPIKIPKLGIIAGSRVQDGKITSGSTAKLLRDSKPIHEGQITGLKRFKDDVKEVIAGLECGIRIEGYQDYQEGDVIESYQVKQA